MAAHLYWRTYITGTTGGYVGYYSVDYQDASGTSLCVGGTPIASSQYAYYAASRAFPGSGAANWISAGEGAGAWIGYQFTAPVDVQKVALCGHGPCADAPSQPTTASLQYSDDGVHWADRYETDEPAGGWVYGTPTIYNVPPPVPAATGNANLFAFVTPVQPNAGPAATTDANQLVYVMPVHDIPLPSGGAFVNQLAFVFVDYEFIETPKPHGYLMRQLWGFPYMIQQGL